MRVPQTRKRRIALLLIVCLIATATGYKLWSMRTPLARAARVIAEPTDDAGEELGAFAWMPPNHILGFYGDRRNWYPYTLDIRTRQRQRLEPLHRLVVNQHGGAPFWIFWEVSPDGKWLLWGDDHYAPSEFFVAALNGSRAIAWRNQPLHKHRGQKFREIVWHADSRAWLLFFTDRDKSRYGRLDYVRIYSLDTPHPPQTVSLKALKIEPDLVCSLPTNRILTYDKSRRQLSIFALDAPVATLKQHLVQANVGGAGIEDYIQILPSPQGDRLAWCVAQVLQEPLPVFDKIAGNTMRVRLLVSRLDGSDMRELGTFGAYVDSESGDHFGLHAWSADGKRLLLLHDTAFWWLTVDS